MYSRRPLEKYRQRQRQVYRLLGNLLSSFGAEYLIQTDIEELEISSP